MRAARLGYGDANFAAGQGAALGYGMMPIDMGLQGMQHLSDFDYNVNAPPPQMMNRMEIPTGGGYGGYGQSEQPTNVNVNSGNNPMDPLGVLNMFGG